MIRFALDRAFTPNVKGPREKIALDRSLRTLSTDGHLHVAQSNISKSVVNPYWGEEIPGHQELGLDPKKKYFLWRHPDELKRAAPSFNNLPILADHVPHTAEDNKPEIVIGSTGTDAVYQHPFLRNSLVFWTKPAIDSIQSGKMRELSCAYHYTPDMRPGTTPDGLHYDGVMRNIEGNHVALVEDGRAGSDVLVADSMPSNLKEVSMAGKKLSPAAMVTRGALFTYMYPRLAKDHKMALDYNSIVQGVTSKNYERAHNALIARVKKAADGKLAKDADIQDLANLLNALKPDAEVADQMGGGEMPPPAMGGGAPPPTDAEPSDTVAQIKAYLEQEGVSPDIINNLDAFLANQAATEGQPPAAPPPEDNGGDAGDPNCPPGMDEGEEEMDPRGGEKTDLSVDEDDDEKAEDEEENQFNDTTSDEVIPSEQEELLIREKASSGGASDRNTVTRSQMNKAIKTAQDAAIKNQREIRDAEKFVRPWVGDLAMDANTAADIYRATLKTLGVKGADKMHADALRPVLEAQPKPQQRIARDRNIKLAQDSKVGDFNSRWGDQTKHIRLN